MRTHYAQSMQAGQKCSEHLFTKVFSILKSWTKIKKIWKLRNVILK